MALARRRFLASTALAGFGALSLALAPRQAGAIRIEEGDAVRESLLREACETRSAHERLIKELIADRVREDGGPDAEAKAVAAVEQMSCPICGCRLINEG